MTQLVEFTSYALTCDECGVLSPVVDRAFIAVREASLAGWRFADSNPIVGGLLTAVCAECFEAKR